MVGGTVTGGTMVGGTVTGGTDRGELGGDGTLERFPLIFIYLLSIQKIMPIFLLSKNISKDFSSKIIFISFLKIV
jgi:hypothetical protein